MSDAKRNGIHSQLRGGESSLILVSATSILRYRGPGLAAMLYSVGFSHYVFKDLALESRDVVSDDTLSSITDVWEINGNKCESIFPFS